MRFIPSLSGSATGRFAAMLILAAGLVHAAAIPIFNTGVDAGGAVLPDGTIGDPHYRLAVVPAGLSTSQIRILTSASGYPIPPWAGDNTLSRWIGPNNDPDANGPAGTYEYITNFDLTGFDPATASITGQWATDDPGTEILINGVATGNTSCCYTAFTPFTINSGFVSGMNELRFRVVNQGGPTGLRVEVAGAADAVPEPASALLAGSAMAALAILRSRKRQAARASE